MGIESQGPTRPAGNLTPKQVKTFQNVEPKALGVSLTFTATNPIPNASKSAQEYLLYSRGPVMSPTVSHCVAYVIQYDSMNGFAIISLCKCLKQFRVSKNIPQN